MLLVEWVISHYFSTERVVLTVMLLAYFPAKTSSPHSPSSLLALTPEQIRARLT